MSGASAPPCLASQQALLGRAVVRGQSIGKTKQPLRLYRARARSIAKT
jgi:hypothetical protein